MAMMSNRDKPTYYNLITEDGVVVATVSKSEVFTAKDVLEKELNEKLEVVLVIE